MMSVRNRRTYPTSLEGERRKADPIGHWKTLPIGDRWRSKLHPPAPTSSLHPPNRGLPGQTPSPLTRSSPPVAGSYIAPAFPTFRRRGVRPRQPLQSPVISERALRPVAQASHHHPSPPLPRQRPCPKARAVPESVADRRIFFTMSGTAGLWTIVPIGVESLKRQRRKDPAVLSSERGRPMVESLL